jgi:hypothetical protein
MAKHLLDQSLLASCIYQLLGDSMAAGMKDSCLVIDACLIPQDFAQPD